MKISPTFSYKNFTIKDLSSNSIEDIKLTVLVDVLCGMSKKKAV